MRGVKSRLNNVALVVASLMTLAPVTAALAEDLIMPFACDSNGSDVQITPANETIYRIAGRRDEQPFAACGNGRPDCETMMVHRFAIECGGTTVPWSRVVSAAKDVGVAIPAGLPLGYAPVSTLSGRFVLPPLTRTAPAVTRVAMQDLSPDSVLERHDDAPGTSTNTWVTEVRADVFSAAPSSNALRVAGSLAAVLAMLFAVSMVAAGRWRVPLLQAAGLPALAETLMERLAAWSASLKASVTGASISGAAYSPSDDLANAMSFLLTRLAETECAVAGLGADLLLRDVLGVEVSGIRGRVAELERQMKRYAPAKSAAIIRTLLRELDRIGRISQSAYQQPATEDSPEIDMPQSAAEAYRVLGINADASPAIAKKLVDALRMSWHPDHARDEADRLRRESRMKQINAAWDLIKDRRVAA
ncbi:MAG: J domain-containing protein [Hyphomicrobium sp.]